MMKSLLKHDLKRMLKILVYIYVIALGLAGITRLFYIGQNIQFIAIIGYIFSGLTYSAIGSIFVNTFVQIIRVFVVNFYKDESYLTHTLPVSKNKLLLSKYISSLIVILTSVIVMLASLFIMLYSDALVKSIRMLLEVGISGFNISIIGFIFLIALIIFTQICSMISISFCSIIIANRYNDKRIIKGFAWFVGIYILSIVTAFVVSILISAITGNLSELFASTLSQGQFLLVLVTCIVVYSLYAVVLYFVSQKLFNKGVNVD